MEWFDAWLHEPPKDGAWIIAVEPDYSGLDFLQWWADEHYTGWVNGEGEGDLLDEEDFRIRYEVWTFAPKWMRPRVDGLARNKAQKGVAQKYRP